MTDRTEREGPLPNGMDAIAERLAEAINTHWRMDRMRKEDVSLRMISDFCWALGIEPELKLVRRPTEATSRGGEADVL